MSEKFENTNTINMEETGFEQMLEESLSAMSSDQNVVGTVVGFTNTEIQVEIAGRKHTGYVPFEEYSDDPAADPKAELKVGDEIKLRIMKTNDVEGTIKLSKRLYDRGAIWEGLEADDTIREGVVTGIVGDNKGVFVSWQRIKHPSEVVSVGDAVEVYVKELDRENKKISLGYKKVEDNPWEILKRDYPVDSEVDAKIVSLTSFGAFAQIIPGVDGLVHISQISHKHIGTPAEVLKVGDVVKAKIMEIDFDKKRVSLSIKALVEPPVVEETPVEEVAEEATEAPAEE